MAICSFHPAITKTVTATTVVAATTTMTVAAATTMTTMAVI